MDIRHEAGRLCGSVFLHSGTIYLPVHLLALASRLPGCLVFNLALGLIVSAIAAWSGLSFMIANGAHVAGLATGAVIGFLPIPVRRHQTTARRMRLFDPPPPPPELPPPTQPYDG